MDFRQRDLCRGVGDPRLVVRLLGGHARRREAQVVESGVVHRGRGRDGKPIRLHDDVVVLVIHLLRDLGRRDDDGRRTVGHRAGVEPSERPSDHRRLERRLHRDLAAEVCLGVLGAVGVVLDRNAREVFARPAALRERARRRHREQRRGARRRHEGRDRVAEHVREPVRALVGDLLDTAREHDVVHAGRDGEARVAERVHAAGAVVLDPRGGDSVQAQGVGGRRSA